MLKKIVSLFVLVSGLSSFAGVADNYTSLVSPIAIFTVGSNTYVRYGEVTPIDANNLDVMPYISENRTYIPVRALCEAFNVSEIYYDDSFKVITIIKGNRNVSFQIDTPMRYVNTIPYPMEVNSVVKDGRTYLPARFIAEALGIKSIWNEDTNTVLFLELSESDFYDLLTGDDFKAGSEISIVGAIGTSVGSGLYIVLYELIGGCTLTLYNFGYWNASVKYPDGTIKLFDNVKKQFVIVKSFNFDLLSKMPQDKNYMVSPYSLKMALAMSANGASGETEREITDTIQIYDLNSFNYEAKKFIENADSNELVEFNIANSIWFNKDYYTDDKLNFSEEFRNNISRFYNGTVSDIDNKTGAKTINDRISKETNGKIDNVISDDMVKEGLTFLVNTIYFKGDWAVPFKSEYTRDNIFTDRDQNEKTTAFMNDTGYYLYYESENLRMLSKPYNDSDTSMYFVLPKSGNKITEAAFYDALDNAEEKYIHFSLPKFKTEYLHENFIDILKEMGIKTAFSEAQADFLNMYSKKPPENIFINIILQKTFIEVDEKGTEAAAATAVGGGGGQAVALPKPIEFICDKPFNYFIINKNMMDILFMGEYAYAE